MVDVICCVCGKKLDREEGEKPRFTYCDDCIIDIMSLDLKLGNEYDVYPLN